MWKEYLSSSHHVKFYRRTGRKVSGALNQEKALVKNIVNLIHHTTSDYSSSPSSLLMFSVHLLHLVAS